MRHTFAVAAAAAGLALAAGAGQAVQADSLPTGGQFCAATSPGADAANPAVGPVVHSAHCTYTALSPSGYVAAADSWTLTVSRGTGAGRRVVRVYQGGRNAGPDKACRASVFVAGDIIDVSVTNGVVVVGDPRRIIVNNGPVHADLSTSQNDIACPA
ncbi:MAG TPA: hypothetical protein VFA94_10055 [Acidimicrobiales bacterium]|nr:hypothetical protein [Acidimicrobiales bacterium]